MIAMLFVSLLNLLTAVSQPNGNEVDGDSSHRDAGKWGKMNPIPSANPRQQPIDSCKCR